MIEYKFLIPEFLDGTGTEIPPRRWGILKAGLINLAGGYTQMCGIEGAWGETTEQCRQFVVSVTAEQEPNLYAMLYFFREKFSQQAIYIANGKNSWLIDHQTSPQEPEHMTWARENLKL